MLEKNYNTVPFNDLYMVFNLTPPYPFILSLCFLTGSNSTSLDFNIVHNDNIVGSLQATRFSQASKTYYHSSTLIQTRLIREIKVDFDYDVIFENSILKKADVTIYFNEKLHTETNINWEYNRYHVEKNGKHFQTLRDSIDYTTILLYFKEPLHTDRCFSEQDGNFNNIYYLGDGTYKKVNSKGRENIYYY